MNTKEQANQLRLAADILETGHPWECRVTNDKWIKNMENDCPLTALAFKREIRPILATPPDGRALHNPDNLTAEQVGVGYRLTIEGEDPHPLAEVRAGQAWRPRSKEFVGSPYMCINDSDCYRLPLSVPWPELPIAELPKSLVELDAEQHAAIDAVLNETIHDPYAELKAAHAAGKIIEGLIGCHWVRCRKPTWEYPIETYRIKPEPEFTLPQPPPGIQWHRKDGWKSGDLPQGYRPMVSGEIIEVSDQVWFLGDGPWGTTSWAGKSCNDAHHRMRTTRPLTFTHLGKTWTWHKPGDPMPCDGEAMIYILCVDGVHRANAIHANDCRWSQENKADIIGWRYAEPVTKTVPLGLEDVPPGSVLYSARWPSGTWEAIFGTEGAGLRWKKGYVQWSSLAKDFQINRSIPLTGKWNPDAWEPCSKQIPA